METVSSPRTLHQSTSGGQNTCTAYRNTWQTRTLTVISHLPKICRGFGQKYSSLCSCLILLTKALDKSVGILMSSGHQDERPSPSAPFTMKASLKCSPSCSCGVHLPLCFYGCRCICARHILFIGHSSGHNVQQILCGVC